MSLQSLSKKIVKRSEAFAEVMSACTSLLKHNKNAYHIKNYLNSRIPEFNYGSFSFGYFPDNNKLDLLLKYVDESKLLDLGLLYNKYINDGGVPYSNLFGTLAEHNLVMPYRNLNGDIIAMVGRSLLSDQEREVRNISKYKNTKFHKSLNLFGLYDAKQNILDKGYVIVVEGQFDCITCHRFGFNNVVALGGISLTKFQLYILLRYTNIIYLLLDNDSPGRKASQSIVSRYKKIVDISSFNWAGKKEKDPDALIKSGYNLNNIDSDIY